MFNPLKLLDASTPLRFLVVGGFNFVFGYGLFALLWWLWGGKGYAGDFTVYTVAAILSITVTFFSHRVFTYRSHGCWWREYLRVYVVYGGQCLLNMGILALLVTHLGWNAYGVQFVTTVSLTVVSYWAHKLYSFRK